MAKIEELKNISDMNFRREVTPARTTSPFRQSTSTT